VGNECFMVQRRGALLHDASCTAYVTSGVTIYVTASSSSTYSSPPARRPRILPRCPRRPVSQPTYPALLCLCPLLTRSLYKPPPPPLEYSAGRCSNTNSYSGFSTGDKIALGCGSASGCLPHWPQCGCAFAAIETELRLVALYNLVVIHVEE